MIASNRLGVKTAISNIRIFFLAIRTHIEKLRRSLSANGSKESSRIIEKSRAAMRTINKRISDPVGLRSPVSHTIRTNGNIRGDLRDLF